MVGETRMHTIRLHSSSGWRIRLQTKRLLSQPEKQILWVFTKLISLARKTLKSHLLASDPNEDYEILLNLRSVVVEVVAFISNVASLFAENV